MATITAEPASAPAPAPPSVTRKAKLRARLGRFTPFSIGTLVVALLIITLTVAPLLTIVVRLFVQDGSVTLDPFREAAETGILEPLSATAIVAFSSMVFAVLIGGGLAWLNERTDARMGLFSDLLPMVPFLLPPVAGSVGWILLLAPEAGYLNHAWRSLLTMMGVQNPGPLLNVYSWGGLILIYTVYGVAFTYMMIAPALRMLDSNLEEQSKICGAGPLKTFFKVTLPAILPAVAAGALLWGWVAFAMVDIPTMIGTGAGIELLSQRIVSFLVFEYPPRQAPAIVLSAIITLVVLAMWFLQTRILRSNRFATVGGKGSKSNIVRLGPWRPVLRFAMLAYVLLTTGLPTLALIIVALVGSWRVDFALSDLSLANFADVLGDSYTLEGLRNSFLLGIGVATLAVLIAAAVSRFIRTTGPVLGRAIDAGIKLPATLGSLVIVVGMVVLFTGPPFNLGGTMTILLIAYLVLSLPHTTVATDAAVANVGESLVEASAITGAGEGKTFRKVVIPLLVPALVSAWAIAFVRTFSDLTASAMLAGSYNPVIGFQMLEASRNGSFASSAVLGTVMAVVSSAVVFTTVWIGRRMSSWATGTGGPGRKKRGAAAASDAG